MARWLQTGGFGLVPVKNYGRLKVDVKKLIYEVRIEAMMSELETLDISPVPSRGQLLEREVLV
jgi:hypothetical protein